MSVRRALSARKTSATDPNEKVTGMPDIAESRNAALSAPLGMANSGFLISSEQKRRTATTYARQADGSLKAFALRDATAARVLLGGGGLSTRPGTESA